MRPTVPAQPPAVPPEAVFAVREARRPHIDLANPPRPALAVDYDGAGGDPEPPWLPRGESPLLANLVRQGLLPPVRQRVGEEPLVLDAQEIGAYGGTWVMLSHTDAYVFSLASRRYGNTALVRWSPQGYPIVPNVARAVRVSDDHREFTFTLRKGMKWSDGQPFTASDILFWWRHEANEDVLPDAVMPAFMKVRGQLGDIERIDDYHVRFRFPFPNGLFLPKMATFFGLQVTNSPEHYLRQYHPRLGDPAKIQQMMRARGLPSPQAVYQTVKEPNNPEHPRLWPWVYRTYHANAPYDLVRNPYYWAVDRQGNQLPYIDRMHYLVRSFSMMGASALSGEFPLQGVGRDNYTLAASEGPRRGYRLVHWYRADRSDFVIHPNLNRLVEPAEQVGERAHRQSLQKHGLLNEPKFRQALSLAINRRNIVDAEYAGQTEVAQAAPGPESPFHEPLLYKAFTEYDPPRADRLLDELGLTQRDWEGMRRFPDGSRMTFFVHYVHDFLAAPTQFVVDDWRKVGIRAVPLLQGDRLFYSEKSALRHDFDVWTGNNEFLPLLEARCFVPLRDESNWGIGFARWYDRGGMHGDPRAQAPNCVEPPPGHPIRRAYELYEQVVATGDPQQQREIFRAILRLAAENVWTISASTVPPLALVVPEWFGNVPTDVAFTWDFLSPGNAYPERFFIRGRPDSPGAVAAMTQALRQVTPPPDAPAARAASSRGAWLGWFLRVGFAVIALSALGLIAVRHPYIGRRLLIMIPTLLVISVLVFVIIQLPPEDFLTARIMDLERSGETANLERVAELRRMFHLDEPAVLRYARWMGLKWFVTWSADDQGLLQGNLGRSMETGLKVQQIVGDRILLTVLIAAGSILLTWALAIPAGIYSAVRQYRLADYGLTLLAFVGMSVPAFLLALILLYLSRQFLGVDASGLFSTQYGAQPEWTWPKVLDLLKHIWVPVVVLGVGGTAGMVRVMRANLLDELGKTYVVAAMARGVRPLRLLLKYPVRLALNPFISGIGGLFPQLVSGGAIVAMVLSLPTVGPLLLSALMMEDMYLAGSMLMVLSLLAVMGTLVSDLLLLWLDPRIRFQKETA